MLEKIKERVKAWKRFYTQDCKYADENSSWYEILMELEYYNFSKFETLGHRRMMSAIATIGTFPEEEQTFLKTLPAYDDVRSYLQHDCHRSNFSETIGGMKVFSVCGAQDDVFPIREYTIVTDREDLRGLEIYIFRDTCVYRCGRHGIIRYADEPPSNYIEPDCKADDVPF